MKYSMIIPVFNGEKYLVNCFQWISDINYTDFEVIFVDDGSNDNSREMISFFLEDRKNIRLFTQVNQGPGIARNIGLENANGQYIWFVDCDDIVNPDAFIILDQIYNNKCDIDILIHKFRTTNSFKRIRWDDKSIEFYDISKRYAIINTNFAPWTRVYKKDFIVNNGLRFSNAKSAEDVVVSVKMCLLAKNIVKTEACIYQYFLNKNGLSKTFDEEKEKDLHTSILTVYNYKKQFPEYEDELDWVVCMNLQEHLRFADNSLDSVKKQKELLQSINIERNVYGKILLPIWNSKSWKIINKVRAIVNFLHL